MEVLCFYFFNSTSVHRSWQKTWERLWNLCFLTSQMLEGGTQNHRRKMAPPLPASVQAQPGEPVLGGPWLGQQGTPREGGSGSSRLCSIWSQLSKWLSAKCSLPTFRLNSSCASGTKCPPQLFWAIISSSHRKECCPHSQGLYHHTDFQFWKPSGAF